MHGEVLLRQCCGLEEGDTHTNRYLHTNTSKNPRSDDEPDGAVVVMASLTKS